MSRHIFAAGLIISVAYAAVHIAFADPTLLTGAAPLRLSVRNYLGNVLGSGMVWGIFSYLIGKNYSGRWLKALLAGTGIIVLMLAVHYALLVVFGVYNWREAFEYNAQWFILALLSGPVLGLAGAASAQFRWFDYLAVLGFLLEPVIAGLVPGSSYLPRTTTIPEYFAAATLWLIGAGLLFWRGRARFKAQQD